MNWCENNSSQPNSLRFRVCFSCARYLSDRSTQSQVSKPSLGDMPVNINQEEAVSILEMWKTSGIDLQLSASRSGANEKLTVKVEAVRNEVIDLRVGGEVLQISLAGAEFNGDRRGAPPRSTHGAYLICEYRNGDRYAFYAPRGEYRLGD